jgi:hypothetical protein
MMKMLCNGISFRLSGGRPEWAKHGTQLFRRMFGGLCIFFTFALCFVAGCDESLAPYDIPKTVFSSSLIAKPNDKMGQVWIYVTIKNIYDETIQDTANIAGSFEVISVMDPNIRKTFTLSRNYILSQISNPTSIDSHGILTMDTNDSLVIFIAWGYDADDGSIFPDRTNNKSDPQCKNNLLFYSVPFIFRGSIQIFSHYGPALIEPQKYNVIYTVGPC